MQAEHKIENGVELCNFIELYNKSVGIICSEYIGKHLVIYDEDVYEVINSLNEIKEPYQVKELYIDDLVITDKKIFLSFANLERIHGVPILEITDMSEMFFDYEIPLKAVVDLGRWDISSITNMKAMFCWCASLEDVGDLSEWDISSCMDMSHMFENCKSLISVGDLGGWDMSSCTNIHSMFSGCKSLTDLSLGGWDTSNVTSMRSTFGLCEVCSPYY